MEYNSKKAQESMEKTAQTMGNTIADVIDRLSDTNSAVTLRFEDLTLDAGAVKAKMTGAVKLEATLKKEAQGSSSAASSPARVYSSS